MYLKAELPGGYFRIFENISDLIVPKGHNTIAFRCPKKKEAEEVDPNGPIEGYCWKDAIKALPLQTQFEVAHIVGPVDHGEGKKPDYVEFIMIDREQAYHSVFVFNDKNGVPTVLCTQYSIFLCNDEGKTMEKFK